MNPLETELPRSEVSDSILRPKIRLRCRALRTPQSVGREHAPLLSLSGLDNIYHPIRGPSPASIYPGSSFFDSKPGCRIVPEMEPVSLAFASISMVELCIKWVLSPPPRLLGPHIQLTYPDRSGKKVYELCLAYKNAEKELSQVILEIEGYWLKIEDQVVFLHSHWNSLGERYQVHQDQVLQELQGTLQNAIYALDNVRGRPEDITHWDKLVAKKGEAKPAKYVLHTKKKLERILTQLDRWHRQFDPSWFLLSRMSNKIISRDFESGRDSDSSAISTVAKLREAHEESQTTLVPSSSSTVFLGKDYELKNIEAISLAHSSTGLTGGDRRVIVDHYFLQNAVDLGTAKKDVRDLASILSKVDPAFSSLLPCEGVVKADSPLTSEPQFRMIFTIPPTMSHATPHSLRYILLENRRKYELNERIHLAVSLARSVVFLHASRIVHKNITPENIILLHTENETLGTPFLVGFERFRFDERRTNMTGDDNWEKNIYRHPQRQGLQPEEVYSMRHDIYSVGVCLLEIGLWDSFVHYADDGQVVGPDSELPINSLVAAKNKRKAAAEIKTILIDKAESFLPQLMGRIYTDVVVSCLTCLDRDSPLFKEASDFEDEDGITVGVRYIEKVITGHRIPCSY